MMVDESGIVIKVQPKCWKCRDTGIQQYKIFPTDPWKERPCDCKKKKS